MRTSTPGKSASKNPENSNKGFTLIELLVAIAVVGLIFAVGASSLRTLFGVNLKKSASQMASTFRYLSQKAVMDHLYIRVVYDLDQHAYRVEESTEPQVIDPNEGKDEEDSDKKDDKKDEGEPEETPEEGFVSVESTLLRAVQFSSDVRFRDIQVSYLSEKKEKGTVASYFFPDGYATPTLVHLKDDEEDGDQYTIELFPGGRVRVMTEYHETFGEEETP